MEIIKAVPTNIITGALGVGKTTLIQDLLKSKPNNERWAVLVNEFGEIGIDAVLLANTHASKQIEQNDKIFIREVPGGCMCCTSGLPMQIALNQLLAQARPHRLLIEPSGIGHPKEVIQILGSEHYKQVVALNSTLCLVDARKLSDERWVSHQTFKEQFQIADYIVVTKSDLYQGAELSDLDNYLISLGLNDTPVHTAIKGQISPRTLLGRSKYIKDASLRAGRKSSKQFDLKQIDSISSPNKKSLDDLADAFGITRKEKSSEGFFSIGWVWPAHHWFDYNALLSLLENVDFVRLKALMITNKGIFSFNANGNEISISEHDEAEDSRLELIVNCQDAADNAQKAFEDVLIV